MPNKPLRLYQITDTAAQGKPKAVPELYFSEKDKAKAKRKDLNGGDVHPLRYVVSPGPDHHNYHG